jgi:hypothetical protein
MAKWANITVLDGGLTGIKTVATKMHLLSTYVAGDSYATVNTNTVASVVMATGDFVITGAAGAPRVLTTASGKSSTATASTNQYDAGTAVAAGSSTTTLADTSKAWTTNVFANRAVTITSGTGIGQTGRIVSNTATVLTIATAWAVSPDATSIYKISDDLHIAFSDGTANVLWVTDESSNQAILSGNTINYPALTYTANQPT